MPWEKQRTKAASSDEDADANSDTRLLGDESEQELRIRRNSSFFFMALIIAALATYTLIVLAVGYYAAIRGNNETLSRCKHINLSEMRLKARSPSK
jgi:hypothetical protein